MTRVLRNSSSGDEVARLQQALKDHGFDPGHIDGKFGPGTESAVIAFQKSEDLSADGVVGPNTLKALEGELDPLPESNSPTFTIEDVIEKVTIPIVSKMFPATHIGNIKSNLPFILSALQASELADKPMVLMALATIRAETESFEPIGEFRSRFNTSPNGHPFDLYDNRRRDLGNRGVPDGASFKCRGFVQLTGRANYTEFSQLLGLGTQLVDNPELASDPKIAAQLLAFFIKSKERRIREALLEDDLGEARRLVNGGSHGLNLFTSAYRIGEAIL